MGDCDLCSDGIVLHPDDFVRVIVSESYYSRPINLCTECLKRIQKCYMCRWYNEELKKCSEGPFTVSKEPKDSCGRWKQDVPVLVHENEREEVTNGSPKFFLE